MFGTPDFIGIENYKSLFNDVLFTTSTAVTFKYVFMSVPFKIIFALIVALIMIISSFEPKGEVALSRGRDRQPSSEMK